jgi:hypothetical protein
MLMRDQMMAENIKSAETDPAIVGRSPLVYVALIENRFVITAWRTGEQRARE